MNPTDVIGHVTVVRGGCCGADDAGVAPNSRWRDGADYVAYFCRCVTRFEMQGRLTYLFVLRAAAGSAESLTGRTGPVYRGGPSFGG